MKKIMLILVLIMTMIRGAMAQNDAMYIYRNDGVINAFLKTDIDHVCYSQLDLDSVAHSEYVVQEVWAVDSVYRIPLEIIDSVSFVTPKTVYQPGVVNITSDMREYIVSSDSLLLTFAPNTPSNLIPHVGDKLVNTEGSGGLLSGFIGQVREIETTGNGYSVYCDAIGLTDVFECYYGMYGGTPENIQSAKARSVKDGSYTDEFEWSPGKLTRNLITTYKNNISYVPDENLLVPSLNNAEFSLSLTPNIKGTSFLIVNREYGVNFGISIYGDYTVEEYMALAGSITGGGDLEFIDRGFPLPNVLCDVHFELGAFFRAGFQICTEQKWTQRYRSSFHYEWSSKKQKSLKNRNDIKNVENTHSGIVALKGTYEGGLYTKVGLAFIATSQLDIAEIGLRLEGGMRFEGTALPYIGNKEDALKSTDLYNMMKGQGVELSAYYGTSAYANLFSWSLEKELPNCFNIPFAKQKIIKSCYYVPEFKNTKLEKKDTDYFASLDISGNCFKTDIGFSLQCKSNPVDRVNGYSVHNYSGPSNSAYATFFNKPSKEPYIVFPLVKFGELEMIAEPSAEVTLQTCPDNNHPHVIDLGLPSGTKWCCCNLGASVPEEKGDYYAWGETNTKSIYSKSNYTYYSADTYTYIGSDIAGTSYDVAHVRMGGSWRMPNHDQQMELWKNCTKKYAQKNGVRGIFLISKNGGCLFLPTTSYMDEEEFSGVYVGHDDSFFASYWSSSYSPKDSDRAYNLYYNYYDDFYLNYDAPGGSGGWGSSPKHSGNCVRSVCP